MSQTPFPGRMGHEGNLSSPHCRAGSRRALDCVGRLRPLGTRYLHKNLSVHLYRLSFVKDDGVERREDWFGIVLSDRREVIFVVPFKQQNRRTLRQ